MATPAAAGAAPPPATLPPAAKASECLTAAAATIARLRNPGGVIDIDNAVARLTAENRALLNDETGGGAILQALASQMAVLDSIFLSLAYASQRAESPELAAMQIRQALSAQASYLRSASVLVAARTGARVLP